jgi:hypothetical protein
LTEIVQTFAQKIRGHWKSDRAWLTINRVLLTINRVLLTINRVLLTMSFDRNLVFFAKIGTMGKI